MGFSSRKNTYTDHLANHALFTQDGVNTLVSFDADGLAGDENTGVVIATLQNVDTLDLSTDNIDSDYSLEVGLDPITGAAETQIEESSTTITAETTDAIINPSNDSLAKSTTSEATSSTYIVTAAIAAAVDQNTV